MIFGHRKRVQITCENLVAQYCEVLERGPESSMTVHELHQLPAEKALMKTALVSEAYRLGPESLPIVGAAFLQLATFQEDVSETAQKHIEIAAEMKLLGAEWEMRTKSLREEVDGAEAAE